MSSLCEPASFMDAVAGTGAPPCWEPNSMKYRVHGLHFTPEYVWKLTDRPVAQQLTVGGSCEHCLGLVKDLVVQRRCSLEDGHECLYSPRNSSCTLSGGCLHSSCSFTLSGANAIYYGYCRNATVQRSGNGGKRITVHCHRPPQAQSPTHVPNWNLVAQDLTFMTRWQHRVFNGVPSLGMTAAFLGHYASSVTLLASYFSEIAEERDITGAAIRPYHNPHYTQSEQTLYTGRSVSTEPPNWDWQWVTKV